MDSTGQVNLADKKLTDQTTTSLVLSNSATITGDSSFTANADSNAQTKSGDQATVDQKRTIDVDALLKKLEEDDKILKELEELEKNDRLSKKKLTASKAAANGTTKEITITPITTKTTVQTSTSTPPPSSVTTASKSTSTDRETQPTPPPIATTRSVSTSTTSTNTLSTVSDQISTIGEVNSNPENGPSTLTPYEGGGANLSSSMPSLIDTQQALQLLSSQLNSRPLGPSISPQELDKLMEKLEQDNRILAELDQKVKRISSSNVSSPILLSSSLPTLTGIAHPAFLPALYSQLFPATIQDRNIFDKRLMLPNNAYFDEDIEQIQLLQALIKNNQDLQYAGDFADCIEIPNRGRCRVFIARYSYDPFKQSPNENPESELHLAAGDFILVFGDIDEDGFYFAELLDGRRGLVPSNFVEKLTGEDLFEFQASVLYEGRDGDESTCSYPPEFYDAILDDVMAHSNFQHLIAPEDFHRMNDYIELVESSDIDEEDLSDPERAQATAAKDPVPPPKRLILERQLHKSILLGWLPPDCPRSLIDSYQIYVDGVLKVSVPSNERTRALVEGVDSSIPHRISIRAITPQGRASRDAACTIVVGKNVPFAPCCVKATNISATSALISWLPSNSNFYHVVAVNSVEVKTVGPSTYKHLITGLSSNTMYRVSVRAKPGKLLCSEEKNPKKLEMLTTFVDFRTLPKSLPEPPVDVQIEAGPQDRTLLITWLPVTLDQFGTSNGCPVTGYAVFSAHKKLAEIDSPTGDHALLDISQIESFHKKAVTVRTKSGENLSQDSIACQIPDELIKFNNIRKSIDDNYFNGQLRINQPVHKSHSDSESETEINQLMINATRRSQVFDPVQLQSQNASPAMRGPIVQNRVQSRMQPSSQQSHQHPQQQQQQQFRPQSQQSRNSSQQYPHVNQITNQHNRSINTNQPHQLQQHQHQHQQLPHNQMQLNPQNGTGNFTSPSNMNRADIPSIAITKDLPDSKKPQQGGVNRLGGPSPQPPQRNRQYSDHERSHFGQGRGAVAGGLSRTGPSRQQRDVRYFVALYDYDPLTMSPNPDAANEELPFREGDIIKIYGDKDPDGFYRGELNDRMGFVPCNMVSEVQYDAETGAPIRGQNENDPWAHLPVKKMIALYDYDPQELSPNPDAEMELAFHAGDHIYVYGDLDEDGFYMGELNGNRGLVPSNFLTETIDGTTRHAMQNQVNQGRVGDSRQSQTQQNQFQAQTGHQPHQSSINQQQLQHQQQNYPQQHQQSHLQQQNQLARQSQDPGYGQHQFQGQQQQAISSNQKLPMSANVISQGMRPQGNYGAQSIHQQHPAHHQQQLGPQQRPNSLELRPNQGNQGQLNQMGHQQQQLNQQQQLSKNQQHFGQQQHQNVPQSQQTSNINPISNLLNSGKKMFEEATTPRVGQNPGFDAHGQLINQHEQNHVNQQGINRMSSGLNQNRQQSHTQQQYPQGQQNYSQRQYQQQPQQQQQHQTQSQQQQSSNNRQQFGYGNNGPMMGLMQGQQQNQGQNQQQGPTLSGALGAVKSIFKI